MNTAWYLSYVESGKKKVIETEQKVVAGVGEREKQGDVGNRVQSFSYKMNKV